jgi:hypothetical protein
LEKSWGKTKAAKTQNELFVRLCSGDVPVLVLAPQAGSAFVARMLTVLTTLKSQKRNVLEFMTQAVVAAP